MKNRLFIYADRNDFHRDILFRFSSSLPFSRVNRYILTFTRDFVGSFYD